MTERLRFKVEGMDCASCARTVETGVRRIAGVSAITISTTDGDPFSFGGEHGHAPRQLKKSSATSATSRRFSLRTRRLLPSAQSETNLAVSTATPPESTKHRP